MTIKYHLIILLAIFCKASVMSQNTLNYQTARNGKVFKIFQFPRDQMPHIDGKSDDWDKVPDSYVYGTDLLKDTADGLGSNIDSSDLDVKVKVGWVKGLNRLYFSYEATDDFWDFGRFSNKGYQNDIFEVVVDGDLSGGPFISTPVFKKKELKLHSNTDAYFESHFNFSGVHAQNYHIFTPPINNAWVMIWGHQHWIGKFPYSHYAYDYNFSHGESGKLFLEFWITPYDHASLEGPQQAIESQLEQGKIIGLSWSILDFDGEKRDGHINLSHTTGMVNNASSLCAFKLMPIERDLTKFIQAEWSFKIIDMENRLVSFKDESEGHIVKREWDFGDGNYSNEQNPIYQFKEVGVNKVITLTVEGPAGKSKRTRYSEVMIR